MFNSIWPNMYLLTFCAHVYNYDSNDPNPIGLWLHVCSLMLTSICIVFGNAFTLSTIATTPHLHTNTNVFLVNLAIADICNGLFVLPSMVISILFKIYSCGYFGSALMISNMVSIKTLAFVAVDRYVAIVYPLKYHMKMTKTVVCALISWTWIVGGVISISPIFGWGEYYYDRDTLLCLPDWDSLSYTLFLGIINMIQMYFRL